MVILSRSDLAFVGKQSSGAFLRSTQSELHIVFDNEDGHLSHLLFLSALLEERVQESLLVQDVVQNAESHSPSQVNASEWKRFQSCIAHFHAIDLREFIDYLHA